MIESLKKKNIVVIALVFFIVLIIISTICYINLKKNQTLEVEATVKLIGDGYIIVENDDGEEYNLQTKGEYNIGDRIGFIIKNVQKNINPITGTVVEIDIVSKNLDFSPSDNNDINSDTSVNTSNSDTNANASNPDVSSNDYSNGEKIESTLKNDDIGTEADVVAYINTLNNKMDTYNQDKSIGDSLKSGFVSVVDFLFYGSKIKGKTFEELSSDAKIKVLQIALSIDEKIEKYFPGYKEAISKTSNKVYTTVKSKVIELYLDITTKVCENNLDTCEEAKQGLKDLKTSFSLTWDFIKDLTGIGLKKLKDWYEIWREV